MQKQEAVGRVGNNDWASSRFSLSQIVWRYVRLKVKAAHCASRVGSSLACIHSDAGAFGGVLQMQVDPRASGSSVACMCVHFASSDALSVQVLGRVGYRAAAGAPSLTSNIKGPAGG